MAERNASGNERVEISPSNARNADSYIRILDTAGYCLIRGQNSQHLFDAICSELGQIIDSSDVVLREGSSRKIHNLYPIPAHNDCSYFADFVAWYCATGDGQAGAPFLVSVTNVLKRLGNASIESLSHIYCKTHERNEYVPILQEAAGELFFFYTPWYTSFEPNKENLRAVSDLNAAIELERRSFGKELSLKQGIYC